MSDLDLVRWHDLECGGYDEDLPLWRELALAAGGPVLDIGAGTGRVALDLAARGVDVVALDLEDALLAELRARADAKGLRVRTVCADAQDFTVPEPVALVLIPMQTLQLLPDAAARERCYASIHRALRPGGLLAAALADALESFDEEHTEPPLPDMGEFDGVLYASRPVALRDEPAGVTIERIRETVDRDGRRTAEGNRITLARVTAAEATRELAAAGFDALPERRIAQTTEYVGSTVAVARRA